jgi:hypothetical protein
LGPRKSDLALAVGAFGVALFGFYEEVVLPRRFKMVGPLIPRRVWEYKTLPILAIIALYYATFFSFQLNGSQFLVSVQQVT